MTAEIIATLVKIVVVIGGIMLAVPMMVWLERKLVADFQARIGPNRVGPYGLLQSFYDGIKLLMKEDIHPTNIDLVLYLAAPVVMMLPALTIFAVVPFGNQITLFGHTTNLVIADLPVGVLYFLAISSLGVYGIVLAGWASNNKYSMLGGLRSAAQMVSYELPMGLAVVCAVMMSSRYQGSLSLNRIVESQVGGIFYWNFLWWLVPGFVAFVIYVICAIAETNRAPFDLPEAETELVAGYHTEYSSMKFAMFFLAEYANMLNVSAIATTLFLGGWHSPIPIDLPVPRGSILETLGPIFWFVTKLVGFILFYMWLRATLPRLRYDQLMRFTWKGLVPIALANIMLIATILTMVYPAGGVPTGSVPSPAENRTVVGAPLAAPPPDVDAGTIDSKTLTGAQQAAPLRR